jgi:hypothetical protein
MPNIRILPPKLHDKRGGEGLGFCVFDGNSLSGKSRFNYSWLADAARLMPL